jgi:hypothetical protein
MLSKTAMALVPAASLGATAPAPTTSLAHSRARTTVSSPSTIPIARKTLGTASFGETLPPTLAPRSVAKVGEWFPRTASSPLQKKLSRAG